MDKIDNKTVEMRNNVYGLVGIGVKNAMWNANFDKYAKANTDGTLKGSPYALQYCMKKQWSNMGKVVYGLKTFKEDGFCRDVSERYLDLFKYEDKKNSSSKKAVNIKKNIENNNKLTMNLLNCIDFLNFGTAYTGGNTKSIMGIFQLTDGMNKYDYTQLQTEMVLSPYSNPNTEDTSGASLGERITIDEAHYVYDFSIFPKEYDKYKMNGFKGYMQEDYKDLKDALLISVSNYNSKAKAGCKNEFAMFIEVKEEYNYLLDLNYLQEYVKVIKEDKVIYDLTKVCNLLTSGNKSKVIDKIKNIEIYYNPRTMDIKGLIENKKIMESKKAKRYDLITREEIE